MGLKEEKIYTVEEFEKLDAEGYYFEYHNGKVFSMTAPHLQHQLISNEIATELTIYLRGKPCKIYPNVNVRFEINSETIIVPISVFNGEFSLDFSKLDLK